MTKQERKQQATDRAVAVAQERTERIMARMARGREAQYRAQLAETQRAQAEAEQRRSSFRVVR